MVCYEDSMSSEVLSVYQKLKRKGKNSKDSLLPAIPLSTKLNMQLYIDLVVLVELNTNK